MAFSIIFFWFVFNSVSFSLSLSFMGSWLSEHEPRVSYMVSTHPTTELHSASFSDTIGGVFPDCDKLLFEATNLKIFIVRAYIFFKPPPIDPWHKNFHHPPVEILEKPGAECT